jgi:hypothetical protein
MLDEGNPFLTETQIAVHISRIELPGNERGVDCAPITRRVKIPRRLTGHRPLGRRGLSAQRVAATVVPVDDPPAYPSSDFPLRGSVGILEA